MKRIVISGTYCTGKTLTSIALSLLSGIPVTHALTMREILPQLYPGLSLRQCNYRQLIHLGMRRLEERIRAEALLPNGFISDGCSLQEWLYGNTRLYTGAYPDEKQWKMKLRRLLHPYSHQDFWNQLLGFGGLAKAYAQTHYDLFFHLPIEFDFVHDGHRPTSEIFRQQSELSLLDTYGELGIQPVQVSGSLASRLEAMLHYLEAKPVIPIAEAIDRAEQIKLLKFDAVEIEPSIPFNF